jgi:hypothetical protein
MEIAHFSFEELELALLQQRGPRLDDGVVTVFSPGGQDENGGHQDENGGHIS